MADEVIERVEAEGGDARAKLRRLFALAFSAGELLTIELAIRDWARRDKAVAERAPARRQPAHGIPALAVRCPLPRRRRRRGPLPARLLCVHRQPLHRRPITVRAAARTCSR